MEKPRHSPASRFTAQLLRPLLQRWAIKAAPVTEGTLLLAGLKKKVKVAWDLYAVPHVFAHNEQDLFLAQGYLHAQERLWQMDFNRRLLSGRMAELFGDHPVPWKEISSHFRDKSTLDLDHFMRLMGIRKNALASLKLLTEPYVSHLRAYSEGVNRYIESHLGRLPLEFRLLRYEPGPWQPEDSLTIGKGFAFFLSTALFTRLTLTAVAGRLKDQQTKWQSLFPFYPDEAPVITALVQQAVEGTLQFLNGTFRAADWNPGGQGSNSWVVGRQRSATGAPILCNDPHLRMTLPSTWYLLHLKSLSSADQAGDYEVWGASIPGTPCIHLGHNRWIAWGVTAALCDDAELYREKVHPEEPNSYLVGNEWVKMDLEEEKLRSKGGRVVVKTLRYTRHGPVLSDLNHGSERKELLTLRWTAHEPSQEFRVLYGVNQAKNWTEFQQSLSFQSAPTLNYVYADRRGNIGYSLAGKVPVRHHSPRFLPLDGWDKKNDWKGYIPVAELPRVYNPPEGVLATANNRIVDSSYPYYLSRLFEAPFRIRRIKELLTTKGKFLPDDMIAMQKDLVSVHGAELIRDLETDLKEIRSRIPDLRQPIDQLLQWDGNCSETSVAASLFHVFYHRLLVNLLVPILGEDLFLAYVEIFNQCLVPVGQILRDPQSSWFVPSSRPALLQKALEETCKDLRDAFGKDMAKWSWGNIHTVTLDHPLGRVKALKPIFSIGPFPSAGDNVTINLGFYRNSNPYRHTVGPSLRMIIPLADSEPVRCILAGGQSGHPFSPHYRDQIEMWRRGDYIRLSWSEDEMNRWPSLDLVPPTSNDP